MKKVFEHVDTWPPLIDKGDIAWEIAIVVVAIGVAIFSSTGATQAFILTTVVLVAMLAMYVWTHVRK